VQARPQKGRRMKPQYSDPEIAKYPLPQYRLPSRTAMQIADEWSRLRPRLAEPTSHPYHASIARTEAISLRHDVDRRLRSQIAAGVSAPVYLTRTPKREYRAIALDDEAVIDLSARPSRLGEEAAYEAHQVMRILDHIADLTHPDHATDYARAAAWVDRLIDRIDLTTYYCARREGVPEWACVSALRDRRDAGSAEVTCLIIESRAQYTCLVTPSMDISRHGACRTYHVPELGSAHCEIHHAEWKQDADQCNAVSEPTETRR